MALSTETADGTACPQLEPADARVIPPLQLVSGDDRVSSNFPASGAPAEFSHYIVPGTGGHGRARADALLAVTAAFACRVTVFRYDATRHDKFLIMAGVRPVLDALDQFLPKIAVGMERAARSAASEYGSQVHAALPQMPRSERHGVLITAYFRAYLRGYGSGAAEVISEFRSGIIAAGGAGLAQVLADQEAKAADVSSRRFPGAAPLRREPSSRLNEAYQAGLNAGRAAGYTEEYAAQHDLVFAML